MNPQNIKPYDIVLAYGCGDEIRDDEHQEWQGYFNGVLMQVIQVDTAYGHTQVTCVHLDLNDDEEPSVRFYQFHVMQTRYVGECPETTEDYMDYKRRSPYMVSA